MEGGQRYCYRHPKRETGLSCSECGRPICYECMTPAPVGLRCPEHSGKPQGIRRVTVAAERAVSGEGSRRPYLVTLSLIAVNTLIYVIEVARYNSQNTVNNWIFNHGALAANAFYLHREIVTCPTGTVGVTLPSQPNYYGCGAPGITDAHVMVGVAHGEWWRLITSAFLHLSILHIGLNMLSLYFGGRILEVIIGRWRFLLLYLVAAVAGSAGALLITPNSPSAGASGAIFGVFGALLVLERRGTIRTGGQVLGVIVINLLFDFEISGISYGAHIGGLIAGILVMLAYLRFRSSSQLAVAASLAVLLAAVVVAYAAI